MFPVVLGSAACSAYRSERVIAKDAGKVDRFKYSKAL